MKKLLAIGLLLTSVFCFGQKPAVSIIPEPASLVVGNGYFNLPQEITINTNDESIKDLAQNLATRIKSITGRNTRLTLKSPASPGIDLALNTDGSASKEGYKMTVSDKGIHIQAGSPAGLFYGIQSFYQLLPAQIEGLKETKDVNWQLPYVTISDQPRFGWRGLMLDVSRHFFTVDEVKQFIDQMVKYKFNILHLHLTDDQGWRIEIKSLPKLTEIGAWRVERTGTFGTLSPPKPGEPRTYGGFYTHEDIRELVKYAKDRFVNILPEIDVPGHSLAAIASYPELSCTPGTYYVSPGDRFMIWPPGGHFYGILDNTLCPANEKVYEFMDKVFTEVAQLFPFEYIHMGGDETARNFWEKTAAIKQLMQKQKLKNLDEVQSYFVKRMEKIIRSKGKKMIGWDEILQGGLAPNAAVMSWRGLKGGIQAAKQGHEVVMSPTDFAYLDYMQGDAVIEPPVYASLRLKKAYQFDPLPDSVNPTLIKGGQANLWTEQIYNTRHMQYMLWPRTFAIAEALWSPKEKRKWENFVPKVEEHFKRLEAGNIKYSPSMYDPILTFSRKDTTIMVKMSTEVEGLDIHYSFDNSFPDNYYPKYKDTVTVPRDAATLKVITYRNNKPIGRMLVIPIAEMKKRAGIK